MDRFNEPLSKNPQIRFKTLNEKITHDKVTNINILITFFKWINNNT